MYVKCKSLAVGWITARAVIQFFQFVHVYNNKVVVTKLF